MTCKICGQKLSKCCCTADDVKQYSDKLEEEIEELQERVQELENANQKLKGDVLLLVRAAVRAYLELNTIRARDGVPLTSCWTKSGGYCCRAGVDEEYFSSVVDGLDAAVRQATGLPAHCHPELYVQDVQENGEQREDGES